MPLELPNYPGSGDPKPALIAFVRGVQNFLDELVRNNTDPQERPLFIRVLLPLMRAAWEEGQPVFGRIVEAIATTDSERLVEHGLSGQQLRYKLETIRYFDSRYRAVGKSVLRRLLGPIDTLLKSIIKAIGLGDAAEELKDYIEKSIDD